MNPGRHFTHTIHGEVKSQTDPRGHTTTFNYDALGRKTRTTWPIVNGIATETATEYDAAGNVRFQTNAGQQTTEYRYNGLNQRSCGNFSSSRARPGHRWGIAARPPNDARGRLIAQTDRNGLYLQIPCHTKPDTPAACRRERRQAERGTHLVRV